MIETDYNNDMRKILLMAEMIDKKEAKANERGQITTLAKKIASN